MNFTWASISGNLPGGVHVPQLVVVAINYRRRSKVNAAPASAKDTFFGADLQEMRIPDSALVFAFSIAVLFGVKTMGPLPASFQSRRGSCCCGRSRCRSTVVLLVVAEVAVTAVAGLLLAAGVAGVGDDAGQVAVVEGQDQKASAAWFLVLCGLNCQSWGSASGFPPRPPGEGRRNRGWAGSVARRLRLRSAVGAVFIFLFQFSTSSRARA